MFGVAFFSAMLGLGRSLYAKMGKNIYNVLILGSIGAFLCYILASLSPVPILGLFACVITGFCVSMLWPGSLIAASSKYPMGGGVVVFALMASGGDLGASVGPQLVGIVTDFAITNQTLVDFATSMSLTPDQLGMKLGMLVGALFPMFATILFLILKNNLRRKTENK